MKALIVSIGENIGTLMQNNASNILSRLLFIKGVEIEANFTISSQKDSLKHIMNFSNDTINTIFILGEVNVEKNKVIKQNLCEILNDDLAENVFSQESVKNYYKNQNIPLENSSLEEAYIPKNAKPIENEASYLQGFYTFFNGKHILYLPNDVSSIEWIYNNFLDSYIEAKFSKLSLTKIIKTFGIKKEEALTLLSDLLKNKNLIKIVIFEEELELSIFIKYSPLTPKEDISAYLKNVVERLKSFIYATSDKTIYECAYELIKEHNVRIATAESITGGNIVSSLIKNNAGISAYLSEGIVAYSNESKITRLNVNPQIINKFGAVSSEVAYEMAVGLLESNEECDYVIATTGYASNENFKNGLVFIAVGSVEGIHIYQNEFHGSRDKIIELTTKTALFYLMKKISQNKINIEQMFDNY